MRVRSSPVQRHDRRRHFSGHSKPPLGDRAGDARRRLPHRLFDGHPRVARCELHDPRCAGKRRRRTRRPPAARRLAPRGRSRDPAQLGGRSPSRRRLHHHPSVRVGAPARDAYGRRSAGLSRRSPDRVLGERRLAETIGRYGIENLLAAFEYKQEVAERRIRSALRGWPDGAHEGETFLDAGPRTRFRLHVRVTKRGERIDFDFRDSDDQADSPVNIRPPLARGCCYYALIAMIDPTLSNNGGVARVVETTFRRGSIVDPDFPAPTNAYMSTCIAVTEACLYALSGFVPERRMAGVGGFGATSIGGTRDDGTPFVQYELFGSAYGGRVGSDGPSGTAVLLSNCRTASIEILENEFPTRVTRWELIPDS